MYEYFRASCIVEVLLGEIFVLLHNIILSEFLNQMWMKC